MNLIDLYSTKGMLYANIVGIRHTKYDTKKLKAESFVMLVKEFNNEYDAAFSLPPSNRPRQRRPYPC
jgi:hypothetical protein